MTTVKSTKGVDSVEPFIYSQVMLSAMGSVSGAVLRGVDPEITVRYGHLAKNITEGSLESLAEESTGPDGPIPAIILGRELTRRMGLINGDPITVISPLGRVTPLGNRAPVANQFRLSGQFVSGMYEYDASFAYISISQAQKFLGLGDSVTGLEVKVKDIYRANQIKEEILNRLGPSYTARDWMEMNSHLFWALKLEKVVMFVILALTVLVAAFNIISTLTMVVMEKTRDIAILKSMGATSRMVMKIFVFQGMVVGGVGTILGFIGGVALCALLPKFIKLPDSIYYVTELPVVMKTMDVTLIALSAFVISFLATLYPAWQAARLDPVEALRYE
jgi:lipoprotein-releasing system permease protein